MERETDRVAERGDRWPRGTSVAVRHGGGAPPPVIRPAQAKLRALRPRYATPAREQFNDHVASHLRPGIAVLDVGGGRAPFLEPRRRSPGVHYAGLDIDGSLLAEAGTYDEMVEADICEFVPELADRFDLIVCWQVLEHVKPLEAAFENMRRYLKPGGVMLAQFSGRWSVFAIANRLLPPRLAVLALRLVHRPAHTVFPAHYHHCSQGRIERALAGWYRPEVTPIFQGAVYFGFSHRLRRLYVRFEDWTARYPGLASYYRVVAQRANPASGAERVSPAGVEGAAAHER